MPHFSLFGFMVGILKLASAFLVGVEVGEFGPLGWWLFLWLGWVLAGVLWLRSVGYAVGGVVDDVVGLWWLREKKKKRGRRKGRKGKDLSLCTAPPSSSTSLSLYIYIYTGVYGRDESSVACLDFELVIFC
nr:hypothetical protein CFP56_35328 [Quercus suber]